MKIKNKMGSIRASNKNMKPPMYKMKKRIGYKSVENVSIEKRYERLDVVIRYVFHEFDDIPLWIRSRLGFGSRR